MITIKRNKECSSSPRYARLGKDDKRVSDDRIQGHHVPKGCVPVMAVGKEEETKERFVIPAQLLKHPSIVELLDLSADEFGFNQQSVLHIPCEPTIFQQILSMITSSKR